MKPNDLMKSLTTKLIDLMKKGGKWTKPWANKRQVSGDGWNYSGINLMWLAFAKYDRKVWGTYKLPDASPPPFSNKKRGAGGIDFEVDKMSDDYKVSMS